MSDITYNNPISLLSSKDIIVLTCRVNTQTSRVTRCHEIGSCPVDQFNISVNDVFKRLTNFVRKDWNAYILWDIIYFDLYKNPGNMFLTTLNTNLCAYYHLGSVIIGTQKRWEQFAKELEQLARDLKSNMIA